MKHRYQTRGVVGGAYKLLDIVSLEMTLNESHIFKVFVFPKIS